MTKYCNKPIQVRGLTVNKISLGCGRIQLFFNLKNGYKKVILNLNDIFFLLSIPFNFVRLSFFKIYKKFIIMRKKYCIIRK